jgi:predicted secreted protein
MSISLGIAIYFILWWLVLFTVLPWGVRSHHESGEVAHGTDPAAPAIHRGWRTMMWTTAIATIVYAILYAVYATGVIPMDMVWAIAGPPRQ